jgi:hypothetical protein
MYGLPEKPRRTLAECLGVLRVFGAPALQSAQADRPAPDLVEVAQYREQAVQDGIISDAPVAA